jgi:hypothetical protein
MDGSIIQVFSQSGKSFQNVFFLPRKEHGYTIPMASCSSLGRRWNVMWAIMVVWANDLVKIYIFAHIDIMMPVVVPLW